jgi:hypothetical protein
VRHARHRLRLALQPRLKRDVAAAVLAQHLERDVACQLAVALGDTGVPAASDVATV